jgi:1,2-beta-oligoglucan phosphorylase
MIIQNKIKTKSLGKHQLKMNLLESGDIYDVSYGHHQINLLKGNLIDGTLSNIYLRLKKNQSYVFTKCIGSHTPSSVSFLNNQIRYDGIFEGVTYTIFLTVYENKWQYDIRLSSDEIKEVELFYGQDIAIQNKNMVLNSEPYTVQYIDYKVFKDSKGYTLCARQNQGQSQYFQMGSNYQTVGYVTDGFQFFKTKSKLDFIPDALKYDRLESKIYQYEFSYFVLQTGPLYLTSESQQISFYGYYQEQHDDIITKPKEILFESLDMSLEKNNDRQYNNYLIQPQFAIKTKNVNVEWLNQYYPKRYYEEYDHFDLLSFFGEQGQHIVLKNKELKVERPHGHMLLQGDILNASEDVLSSTHFIFGVFNSHFVLGNTSFNKFLSNIRSPLNTNKASGLRIYLKYENQYQLMSIPSVFEMGLNYVKWVYLLENDEIEVLVYGDISKTSQTIEFKSKNNILYDFIVTMQIVFGTNENAYDIPLTVQGQSLTFHCPKEAMAHLKYPNMNYLLKSHQPFDLLNEKDVFNLEVNQGLVYLSYKQMSELKINLSASMEKEHQQMMIENLEVQKEKTNQFYQKLLKGFEIEHPSKLVMSLNILVKWYAMNALVHYASPHGLEQYNGAAWGTRDVSQGPFEFFAAVQETTILRKLLLKIYQRQFIENADFPQWFMFDKYYQIQAHDAHGDIIIWPLRALTKYLEMTNDLSILDEEVAWMSIEKNDFIEKSSLMNHVKMQIDAMKSSFIPNTHLPKYGGGDWDDTLQPANQNLKETMVSAWTVALMYEAINRFSKVIVKYDQAYANDLFNLVKSIKKDYQKYIIQEGIPVGFYVFDQPDYVLLHPNDQKTSLKYRLLPMTRSTIAELASETEVLKYIEIIEKHLKHPDGVRLTDDAIPYHGGQKTFFQRAETATNFGREIGLQYVHAHIRYIEAMAKSRHAHEALEALMVINPILSNQIVKNADFKQNNVYFSSSDAAFMNRYEAMDQFHLVKDGSVKVKGGWRLYSSGPGILISQIIENLLGIKVYDQNLCIMPSLDSIMEGLVFKFKFDGLPIKIKYHFGKSKILINKKEVSYETIYNAYHLKGYIINKDILKTYQKEIDIDCYIDSN